MKIFYSEFEDRVVANDVNNVSVVMGDYVSATTEDVQCFAETIEII